MLAPKLVQLQQVYQTEVLRKQPLLHFIIVEDLIPEALRRVPGIAKEIIGLVQVEVLPVLDPKGLLELSAAQWRWLFREVVLFLGDVLQSI